MTTYDLAVVGGGVIGLAHAYVAARAGKRVAVIERDPRANGASIRNFGFITVTGQERGETWALARRTRDVWDAVAQQAGIPVLQRGLLVAYRSPEAAAVAEAFLETEMGAGCRILGAGEPRATGPGLDHPDMLGALYSPHELRVESREAIPRLAAWLAEVHGVTFHTGTAVHGIDLPRIETARGTIEAEAAVVCPGDDFVTLYPELIAGYALRRCRLSMLRLADPGWRFSAPVMSDLSLARYRGYAALPEARALEARLRSEAPRAFDNGVHLIVAQSGDGSLVVGDSHHYADLPDPFAPASAEEDILAEYARATGHAPSPVIDRWTGTYAVADDRTFLIDTPARNVRLVMVTTGAGASTCFGLTERTLGDLFGQSFGEPQ
jgi:FAD dependent oxidoreductase TIGR03364